MRFTPYNGLEDRDRMLRLVWDNPANHPHVIDLPYRLCSWAFEDPPSVGLWEDDHGILMGWVVMQAPFWTIDLATSRDAPPETLGVALSWVDKKARASLGTPHGRPSWFVSVREADNSLRSDLEGAAFTSQNSDGDSWSQVRMGLNADIILPPCPVKPGYRLRPLAGEREVPAYVALHHAIFGTTNMTESWRLRTLFHPAYRSDLDLVIEDQEGAMVAFCVGWLATLPGYRSDGSPTICGQIEPIGVIEHGRRHGLAWSIIAEVIRRMRDMGAEMIVVHTDNNRERAFAFYQAVGFQIKERILMYRKDYE